MSMISKWLKKKESKELLTKLETVKELMPTADITDFFSKLMDTYSESQITKRELAQIHAQKEILILEIQNKYDLYHSVFDKVFAERRVAIDKNFEIIDKGLASGDKDLISMGLQNLSKVVSSSPFGNIQQLSNMLEGNKIIEI
ncbi:hypothetical protein G5B47_24720 [Paenibacillus sp. 7124]|uniref:Uncharacterized protein n=1 Tax=Paenibacillus apii TaxID=1850370 RepID=A0A6M1PPC3_9BACL|nr:hypothetical protein [Paenibacillus apii]NGM85607.1 hypothetical protein [Paenibacillus apii]NJJ40701.1 hypothetical protein [Paenibacillus apii]